MVQYRHQPDRLVETDDIVMWDTSIPIARKIKANRSDICLKDKKANTCLLIDISCPADGNVGRKYAEKLAKYGDLRVEISRMWQCDPGGIGSFGCSARRYCTVAGQSCLPLFRVVIFGLSTSEVGFASGTCDRPYEPD